MTKREPILGLENLLFQLQRLEQEGKPTGVLQKEVWKAIKKQIEEQVDEQRESVDTKR